MIYSFGLLSFMGLQSAVTSVFRKFHEVCNVFLILILIGPLNIIVFVEFNNVCPLSIALPCYLVTDELFQQHYVTFRSLLSVLNIDRGLF